MHSFLQNRLTVSPLPLHPGVLGLVFIVTLLTICNTAYSSTVEVDASQQAVKKGEIEVSASESAQSSALPGENPDNSSEEGNLEFLGRAYAKTLRHEEVSRAIENLSKRIDAFFGDDRLYDEITKTYASFKLTGLYARGGELSTETRFRLRLDLPRTKNRIKLRLESEDDEISTLGTPEKEDLVDDDINASLQWILQETSNWSVSLSPGLKLRAPLDAYTKLRLRRGFNLFSWHMRFVQAFEWYESTGYGSKSTIYFDRIISDRSLLRLISEAYRNQEDYSHNNFRISQQIHFFYSLNNRVKLSTELALIGHTQPNWQHDYYMFNIRARRNIHQGFVFLELTPHLGFARDNAFHGEAAVMLTLEILFGADYTK